MPSRKQRRRREKSRRHEYEYVDVLVDETGNEIELDPAESPLQKDKKERSATRTRSGRPVREVKPPSWSRAARRALLFVPLLFVFLSLGKNAPPVPARVAISLLYAGIFIPMFFWVDRFAYRAYRKRLERG